MFSSDGMCRKRGFCLAKRLRGHGKIVGCRAACDGKVFLEGKSFPFAEGDKTGTSPVLTLEDEYFYQLVRYVERNALRANLVQHAEEWKWSSLWRRELLDGQGIPNESREIPRHPIRADSSLSGLSNSINWTCPRFVSPRSFKLRLPLPSAMLSGMDCAARNY